jgi:hypothetical protein
MSQLRCDYFMLMKIQDICKGKGKEVPLQAWSCPAGSRKLRFPDLMTRIS